MQKIKIIDLLNKMANGEEVPKKVKFDDKIFEYDNDDYVIKSEYPDVSDDYLFDNICANKEELNFEVEIIGNTPKDKIDHLERTIFSFSAKDKNSTEEALIKLTRIVFEVREKTDEIVDKVNNLQEQINFIK